MSVREHIALGSILATVFVIGIILVLVPVIDPAACMVPVETTCTQSQIRQRNTLVYTIGTACIIVAVLFTSAVYGGSAVAAMRGRTCGISVV